MPKYAIPPVGCGPCFTPGKAYLIEDDSGVSFHIRDDDGERRFCLWKDCAHANGDWTPADELPSVPPPPSPDDPPVPLEEIPVAPVDDPTSWDPNTLSGFFSDTPNTTNTPDLPDWLAGQTFNTPDTYPPADYILDNIDLEHQWLIPYLKSWWGITPPLLWGTAMSMAMEAAYNIGFITSPSNTTPTKLGEKLIPALVIDQHDQ